MTPTPGPWRVWPIAGSGSAIVAPDDSVIVRVPRPPCRPIDEDDANLRLIAEAPTVRKLLHAAEHALRSYKYGNTSPDLAASVAAAIAIQLAEGQ